MASRSRYVKLAFASQDKVTGKNSIVGAVVIADYVSNGERTIVVERPLTATGHRATKPKTKPRINTKPDTPTMFPPVEAAHG